MEKVVLNDNAQVNVISVGDSATPVVIIDHFVQHPEQMLHFASQSPAFNQDTTGFYPGSRKPLPQQYAQRICVKLLSLLKDIYNLNDISVIEPMLCALSLTTTSPDKLRPIQTVPHIDSPSDKQFAMVHFLCGAEHGGTSFYRHNQTQLERISQSRLSEYGHILQQQAIKNELHKNLAYINGDTALFTRIHSIAARMNRAIIYPSNLLHSGNINPETGLSKNPTKGRLTANMFMSGV